MYLQSHVVAITIISGHNTKYKHLELSVIAVITVIVITFTYYFLFSSIIATEITFNSNTTN